MTKQEMLNYLDARIKIAEDHVEWYKEFGSEKSYKLKKSRC